MSTSTMDYAGSLLHVIPYGPLTLVSRIPTSAEAIDASTGDEPLWEHLGLLIDPARSGNAHEAVVQEIRLFMDFEAAIVGVEWDLDPHLLASRIYLATTPVVVPFWKEL